MSDHQSHYADAPTTNLPIEFNFEDHIVRPVKKDGEVWFVADDLCKVLEHTDTSKAVSRLDEDEKGTTTVRTPGGEQNMLIVNESGLYGLILTSRKPQAKRFKRWVTREVLPALRKTGRYEVGQKAASEDKTDLESEGYARVRLFKIYREGQLNPDDLLRALFGGKIPYTGDKRFPLLARESCEALGICDMSEALERLPPLEKGVVNIDTGGGPCDREAITEAALYALAFSPRDLSGPQLAGAKAESISVPKVVGKYILTILPNGDTQYYRVSNSFLFGIDRQLDALALCHQIKTFEAFFDAVRDARSIGVGLEYEPAFQNLERSIANAVCTADLQLAAARRDKRAELERPFQGKSS